MTDHTSIDPSMKNENSTIMAGISSKGARTKIPSEVRLDPSTVPASPAGRRTA
nr:hypothetical protein [Actinomycetota bacterium]